MPLKSPTRAALQLAAPHTKRLEPRLGTHVASAQLQPMHQACTLTTARACPHPGNRWSNHATRHHPQPCALQVKPLLQAIPPNLYGALPFALAPVVGNPVLMALSRIPESAGSRGLAEQLDAGRSALLGMLPLLQKLADVLPQDTLLYKLELLRSGCEYMDRRYAQVRLPLRAARGAGTRDHMALINAAGNVWCSGVRLQSMSHVVVSTGACLARQRHARPVHAARLECVACAVHRFNGHCCTCVTSSC